MVAENRIQTMIMLIVNLLEIQQKIHKIGYNARAKGQMKGAYAS